MMIKVIHWIFQGFIRIIAFAMIPGVLINSMFDRMDRCMKYQQLKNERESRRGGFWE